jgi:hypothetical protein
MQTYTDAKTARDAALAASKAHPGQYATLVVWPFEGLRVSMSRRLHVFAPSDSWGDTYWLNGKVKQFSDAQRDADERATPFMD